tara:strand:+ start:326 stop:616 length:291 start_codon:yes stop_codon:yes gene_type:complete
MSIPEPIETVFYTSTGIVGKEIEVELSFDEEINNECGYCSTCHLYMDGGDRKQDASSSLEFAKDHGGLEGCNDQEIVKLPMSIINEIEEWAISNGY